MDTPESVPVIFRILEEQVIAIFPTIPGTYDAYTCSSYMHVGQHGACDPVGLMQRTEQAPEYTYRDLKRELESAPYHYKLEVRRRLSRSFLKARQAELARMSTAAERPQP